MAKSPIGRPVTGQRAAANMQRSMKAAGRRLAINRQAALSGVSPTEVRRMRAAAGKIPAVRNARANAARASGGGRSH